MKSLEIEKYYFSDVKEAEEKHWTKVNDCTGEHFVPNIEQFVWVHMIYLWKSSIIYTWSRAIWSTLWDYSQLLPANGESARQLR
jgi:hypothetical protein